MNFFKTVGLSYGAPANADLPEIFSFLVESKDFIRIDVTTTYKRILTDVLERTQGLKPDHQDLLADSCLGSEKADGLVSLLARAMCDQKDLFVVYDKATKVVREATMDETKIIRLDYERETQSSTGFYLSFKSFDTSQMLKIYSSLEYCAVVSLWKNMNTAKALQFKMAKLRASVSEGDSDQVIQQAKDIAKALGDGRDVLLDGDDSIETLMPDMQAAIKAMDFIAQKQSFYLGVPSQYLTGVSTGGLGDSGAADSKAVDRGLKPFFQSIIKPVLDSIFESKVTFKSEDMSGIATANSTLTTFEATTDELLSQDDKKLIIRKQYGLSTNEN